MHRSKKITSDHDRQKLFSTIITITTKLRLADALQQVIRTTMSLSSTQCKTLNIVNPHNKIISFVRIKVSSRAITSVNSPPSNQNILKLLIRRPMPLHISSLNARPTSSKFPTGRPPVRSFLNIPIQIHNQIFNGLCLARGHGKTEFATRSRCTIATLTTTTTITVRGTHLFRHAQRHSQ